MKSSKSSIDYAELAGLTIALANLKNKSNPETQTIIDWMKARIKELEEK